MESEESVYVNLQELREIRGKTEHQGPEETKTKAVGTRSEAEEETETRSPLKGVSVCLGLLCFLLLTAVIAVAVKYDTVFSELSRELANHTAEKHQLLTRNQNLTDEREQLQTSLKEAAVELSRTVNNIGEDPSHTDDLMDPSKEFVLMDGRSLAAAVWLQLQQCLNQGANLVIITSWKEMVFLNQLGAHLKFWIGLSKSSGGSWTWTDGRHTGTTYWKYTLSYYPSRETQECAAFNSFHAGQRDSWSGETCTQYLQWVCEKETVPSG
ncbi:C-type lectin domain family 10 member A-like [Archocentrus centrarchus]|uniref:C-type lectin domain family 10 member A-like n=1 Tax=Archocentrus centrarchus TaxID=63155 RepID=UPI0011E9BE9B|nr:C-type lectin domain family 10 member A-like [Archocentrus centrarchus]